MNQPANFTPAQRGAPPVGTSFPMDLPPVIIRKGRTHTWTTQLASPQKLLDFTFRVDGIVIEQVKLGDETFSGNQIEAKEFADYRIFPEDTIEVVFANMSGDDVMLNGYITVVESPIPGQLPAAFLGSAQAKPRAMPGWAEGGVYSHDPPEPSPQPQPQPVPQQAHARPPQPQPTNGWLPPTTTIEDVADLVQPILGRPDGNNAALFRATRRQFDLIRRLARGQYVHPMEREALATALKDRS